MFDVFVSHNLSLWCVGAGSRQYREVVVEDVKCMIVVISDELEDQQREVG